MAGIVIRPLLNMEIVATVAGPSRAIPISPPGWSGSAEPIRTLDNSLERCSFRSAYHASTWRAIVTRIPMARCLSQVAFPLGLVARKEMSSFARPDSEGGCAHVVLANLTG